MSERDIQQEIMAVCGKGDTRLFRNNTGMGWQGKVISDNRVITPKGATRRVVIEDARPLHAGLVKGSADLVGWRSLVIDESHVGQRVAVFVAIEVKAPGGRASDEQERFIRNAMNAGGIGGVVYSVDDACLLLSVDSI